MKIFFIISIILIILFFILFKNKKNEHFFKGKYIGNTYALNKYEIWKILIGNYPREKASKIMADTYLIPNDFELFKKSSYLNDKLFILKKTNVSLRKGISLKTKKQILEDNNYKDYNIIQDYVINQKLINGYIYNLRLYIIIDCEKGIYIMDDGLIYYNTRKFNKNNINLGNGISELPKKNNNFTEDFYVNNNLPSTVKELKNIFGLVNYNKMMNSIINNFKSLYSLKEMCNDNINKNKKSRNIFGPDIIVLDDFTTRICEINSTPIIRTNFKPFKKVNKKILFDFKNRNYDKYIKLI